MFEADLHQIVKSGQALTSEHVQYFVYQILRGIPLSITFNSGHSKTESQPPGMKYIHSGQKVNIHTHQMRFLRRSWFFQQLPSSTEISNQETCW